MSRSAMHESTSIAGRRAGKHFTQRGIALIAIITAMALTAVVVAEFSTNTTVDQRAATNIEADMQAHFLARSAMNLAELVIRVQTDAIDKLNQQFKMDIQLAEYTGLFIGAFGGSKDEVASVAALIGGAGAGELKGLGVPNGSFDIQITTDDGKINLNCASNITGTAAQTLAVKLQSLFYPEAYDPIFQNEDAEGWRRDRNMQVEAIIDYIDRDPTKYDVASGGANRGAPEDYGYETLDDDYLPKNYALDTVSEIKLVRGVDDRFWKLFGNNFTVYGGCKENLTAISDPKQLASIIALAAKNPDDPVVRDPQKLWNLALLVAKARELGFVFSDVEQFRVFVTDPMQTIEAMGIDPSLVPAYLELPTSQPIEGVEIDSTKLKDIVMTGPRRTYRVEATATYEKLSKRIVGVWDINPTRQNTRTPGSGTVISDDPGAWVFWREE